MRPLVPLALGLGPVVAACGFGDDADGIAEAPAATVTSVAAEPTATEAPTTVASTSAVVVDPTTTATLDPGEPDEVLGAELEGRWAHYDVVAYEDDAIKTLIISYGFNDFTVDDGRLVDQASFCFSEQRSDLPIETSLSDAGTKAIRPPATPLEVAETTDGTLTIAREPTPTPVGIRLDDPFTESLPTDPNDPRIVDDDGDGNPGVTVSITVSPELQGELYIARREIFAYEATQVGPDRIEGTVVDDSEQLVIGASDPVFLVESEWEQFRDPARNPIILIRVDDTWDCDRLVAERDALFPPTPEVDW